MAAMCALTGIAIVCWGLSFGLSGYRWQWGLWAAAMVLWGVAWMVAYRHWRDTPHGVLIWNGAQWCWSSLQPSQYEGADAIHNWLVIGDGQSFLLISGVIETASKRARRWWWLDRDMAPALWGECRRAAFWVREQPH